MLHIYTCIHIYIYMTLHSEIHQSLLEKAGRKIGKYNGGVELVLSILYICMELPQ
jgi:hypothetical protein